LNMYAYGDDPYWTSVPSPMYIYREGTLIIDLTDARAKHLVWRGWAIAPVDEQYTPEKIKARIHEAVEKMFRKFPGRAPAAVPAQKEVVSQNE